MMELKKEGTLEIKLSEDGDQRAYDIPLREFFVLQLLFVCIWYGEVYNYLKTSIYK